MRILPTICVHRCSVASVSCHSSRTSWGQVWLDIMGEDTPCAETRLVARWSQYHRVSGSDKEPTLPPIRNCFLSPSAYANGSDSVLDFVKDRMLESLSYEND